MATSAERQRKYRLQMFERGFVPINLLVPIRSQSNFAEVAVRLMENPDLEIAMLRNTKTGRLEKV